MIDLLARFKNFDFDEFLFKYRLPLTLFLSGAIIAGAGILLVRGGKPESKIEVIETSPDVSRITVEISGAVIKSGVYTFPQGARVEDLLIVAGGISAGADRDWVLRVLNRARKLSDGEKIYIPTSEEINKNQNYQSGSSGAKNQGGYQSVSGVSDVGIGAKVNINIASQKELEELPGIGPVYAQSIIEHRPYSIVEELLSRGVLKKNVYEKIKDAVTVY